MSAIGTIRRDAERMQRSFGRETHVRRFSRALVSFFAWVNAMLDRRRSRLALLEMTDEQLKDIGISRCDAHREGIRPLWE